MKSGSGFRLKGSGDHRFNKARTRYWAKVGVGRRGELRVSEAKVRCMGVTVAILATSGPP